MRVPAPGAPVQVAPGEAAVFGRIRVFDREDEITPWQRDLDEIVLEDPIIRLALFEVESGRRHIDVPVSPDGRFEWIVPAGTYLLYHTPSVEPPYNEPLAAFQVSAGPDPVDLGELLVGISVDRPLFSNELATYTLSNVDAAQGNADTAAAFEQLHPGTSQIRQGTFIVDPELGRLFAHYSPEDAARILARHGVEIDHGSER